jgi:hypothetical protein
VGLTRMPAVGMIQGEFDFNEDVEVEPSSPILEFILDGRKISTMILGGRLANAHCAGAGGRWHAVVRGKRLEAALCGAKPGRRSMGWFPPQPRREGGHDKDVTVNCPRCVSVIAKLN